MAVPGSIRSPASSGTNELIASGMPPARDVDDVVVALGLARPGAPCVSSKVWRADAATRAGSGRPSPDAGSAAVLDALGWEPASAEQLAARTDLGLGPVAVALTRLEHTGWVARSGTWWQRAP